MLVDYVLSLSPSPEVLGEAGPKKNGDMALLIVLG